MIAITLPSLTLSPSLIRTSVIFPANGDGTSIVALSDSSVTSESSALTLSPAFTSTSMTGMSLKSPMSGTLTSIALIASSVVGYGLHSPGIRALRVEAVLPERLLDDVRLDLAVVGKRLQRSDRHVMSIHLE